MVDNSDSNKNTIIQIVVNTSLKNNENDKIIIE